MTGMVQSMKEEVMTMPDTARLRDDDADRCDICCRPKSQHIHSDLQCPDTAYYRPMADNTALLDRIEALEAAGKTLRMEAFMLLQNSEGCATNHYGGDSAQFGMPQWLRDSRQRVETAARALLEGERG